MTAGVPGQPLTLDFEFFNEEDGSLIDVSSLQLDITYGGEVGLVPDFAGPFYYSGATSPSPGVIYRISEGHYGFSWQVPPDAPGGVYTANWSAGYSGDTFLGVENFPVQGGYAPPVPAGDIGFWTGSLAYTPAPGNTAVLAGSTVDLGAVDSNGIAWLLQKVDGWDGPDVQGGGILASAGDHGGTPGAQFYAARSLTLKITATAPTQTLRDLARSLLQRVIPINDLAVFQYNEPIPKQTMIRRSGKITESYNNLGDVTFTCGLVAPDPRKYSAQVTSVTVNATPVTLIGTTIPVTVPFTLPAQAPAGAALLTNAGDFETRPTIIINGPITGPVLTNVTTGQSVSWSALVLAAGDTLEVSFNTRQAFLNGAYRAADLGSSWWVLPAGESTVQLGGQSDSGASMAITFQSAWQ